MLCLAGCSALTELPKGEYTKLRLLDLEGCTGLQQGLKDAESQLVDRRLSNYGFSTGHSASSETVVQLMRRAQRDKHFVLLRQ